MGQGRSCKELNRRPLNPNRRASAPTIVFSLAPGNDNPDDERKNRSRGPGEICGRRLPSGLTSAEADRRRQTFGPNAIADVSGHALGRALEKVLVSGSLATVPALTSLSLAETRD